MIYELVRDVLWAKARVMIEGRWRTRLAWRYIRLCARHEGIKIPPDLIAHVSRGHYR